MVALGIDLGGTSVKIGAVEEGVVLEKARVFTRPDGDYAGIVRDIAEAALPLAEKYGAVRRPPQQNWIKMAPRSAF